uniref:Thaumatin-like protein 9 n=1 Tax=Moniliophthora perniciosa TaxID=153609 RepID=A0A0K2FGM3_MONPR|nr:thaumatin-like protein 9 [Moniliophthora perniciosa]
MKGLFAFALLSVASTASARTFTVRNNCDFTVWPGMYTDPTAGPSRPDFATGWEAAPNTQVSFSVPNDWKAGRIWGRLECDFSTDPGPNSCASGGCNGGLECAADGGTGVPPVTLAEWTLQGAGNLDNYDVSIVDGANIPMAVTNNVNCPVADCPVDLNANCPAELASPAGCRSACFANLDENPQDSPNCCTGSHNTEDTCPSSGVQFYSYFKDACPNAYVYAYDDASALRTCDSGLNADYTLTFCP